MGGEGAKGRLAKRNGENMRKGSIGIDGKDKS